MLLFYGMYLLSNISLLSLSENSQIAASIMLIVTALGCNIILNSMLTVKNIYNWYLQRKNKVSNEEIKIVETVQTQGIISIKETANSQEIRSIFTKWR